MLLPSYATFCATWGWGMINHAHRGPVLLVVTYKSGRKETLKFKNKKEALPTATKLRDMGHDVRMKKDGE